MLYLVLAEKYLEDCIRPELKIEWERMRSNDCSDSFIVDVSGDFFPPMCCDKHKLHDNRQPGLFKGEFKCTEKIRLCSKKYCCYDVVSSKFKFSRKSLNKLVLEQNGDGSLDKFPHFLDEKINDTSTKRSLGTNNHTVVTYGQIKNGFFHPYPKKSVESDEIQTQPLNL